MNNPVRFLSRWSRLKKQADESSAIPVPATAVSSGGEIDALEPVVNIDAGTDLTALLREELSDAVRKRALKAIFADPHFNVMDGLDTYIDDYSISDPIPPEMLATLNQARFLFEEDEVKPEKMPDAAPEDETALMLSQGEGCDNFDHANQKVSEGALAESSESQK